jgi:quercetin dioxygenase-like cupin family protein
LGVGYDYLQVGQTANAVRATSGVVMMKIEQKQFGKLFGSLYSFEERDDKLPMHDHTEENVHVTFVLSGSFRVHGGGWEITSKAGDFIDWQPGQFHEFIALEQNSRFLNIVKGG